MRLAPRAIAFDLDGTLYCGDTAPAGAPEAVADLAVRLEVYFLTNSTVRTRAQIAARLGALGYPSEVWRVYSSAWASARYLRERGYEAVYVVGADALLAELEGEAVPVCGDPRVADALLIGLDLGWERHADALTRLRHGIPIIACNLDGTYPDAGGVVRPGCGTVVEAVERHLGRGRDAVVGKPADYMIELLERDQGVRPHEGVIVGDSEASDIAAAAAAGAASVLVTAATGVVTRADLVIGSVSELPDLVP